MAFGTAFSRRQLLGWIAGSPAMLSPWTPLAVGAHPLDDEVTALLAEYPRTAGEALDVLDMQRVARQVLSPAHYGYIATGVDGEATQARNRASYERLYVRPRRLVDVTSTDASVTLFDRSWPSPILLAPAGSQRAFHKEGEIATARAARRQDHLQVLSTLSSIAVEHVNKAYGGPVWYQLYATSNWGVTQSVVARVREAGCPVIVLTVDLPVGSNRVTQTRWARIDTADCSGCHKSGGSAQSVKPMFQGTPFVGSDFFTPGMTWAIIRRLKDITDQKIVVKGLVTREDAALALENGADGIWVSNHGGRSEGSGGATIDALPEIAHVVGGQVPIIVDGGIRRGTDVFKAISRGATAVAVGRPYLWGLGAFGEPGVARVLQLLQQELIRTMRLAGTPTLGDIQRSSIGRRV